MAKGLEYVLHERRELDRAVFRVVMPVVAHTLDIMASVGIPSRLIQVERVGVMDRHFWMNKLELIGYELPSSLPLDELGQLANITRGEMSFNGRRSLEPVEYYKYVDGLPDRRQCIQFNVVRLTRPGIFGTYPKVHHLVGPGDPLTRFDQDYADICDASAPGDLKNIASFFGGALKKAILRV